MSYSGRRFLRPSPIPPAQAALCQKAAAKGNGSLRTGLTRVTRRPSGDCPGVRGGQKRSGESFQPRTKPAVSPRRIRASSVPRIITPTIVVPRVNHRLKELSRQDCFSIQVATRMAQGAVARRLSPCLFEERIAAMARMVRTTASPGPAKGSCGSTCQWRRALARYPVCSPCRVTRTRAWPWGTG